MVSDINAIVKKYLSAMGKNEAGIAELTSNLRVWAVENGEVFKEKIEKQIDDAAVRMGFVKASDLDSLLARISELEGRIPSSQKGRKVGAKKSKAKREPKSNEDKKVSKFSEKKKSTTSKKGNK
ncbi:unannotated protein [freshwater metagenome]|uniref:Unannotated protein n=1 Tax=freshwater metagenome TaxID=449393 RepID=A0A6J6TAM4_9ZZZZ|nr:hypothetical protein [Actinomycetota bacterium]